MRYQCHECDRRFEEPDIVTEAHGMTDGSCEKHGVCPYCKGYYEEMHQCKICGQHFTDDELSGGVCDECLYEHSTDIEFCYKLGAEEDAQENIKINGFISSVFSPEQIDEILFKRIKEIVEIGMFNWISGYNFIDSDKSWFAEQLIKRKETKQ